jgi:hypothetical protein
MSGAPGGPLSGLAGGSAGARRLHVLRKVLVTLVIGGGTYLVTTVFQMPQIWAVMLSVFVGGVALVVEYLADFENRLELVEAEQVDHFATIENLLREKFTNINEATELFGRVEDTELRTVLTDLLRYSARLDPGGPDLVGTFVRSEIGRISEMVKELGDGVDVTRDGEDHDWLLGLTSSARSSIDATSLAAVDAGGQGFDDGLWLTDLGQRYLDAQRRAVERGVTIRRIFVMDRSDQASDPQLLRICEEHQLMGIRVRILDPMTLPGTRKTSMFDFIVFDAFVSYESTPAAWIQEGMRPSIVHTRLVVRPGRVEERIQRFEDLWVSARDLG